MYKGKKIGMIGVISNPVKSLSSHNGGWTLVCKSIIQDKFCEKVDVLTQKDDWNQYDVLIVNEGANFKPGVYNFFGGVQGSVVERLMKYADFKGEIYSINEVVDYNDVCGKRKELKDIKIDFRLPKIFELSNSSRKLILGDSHSVSIYSPGHSISRNDGKTLNGFLNDGISSYIESLTEEVIFYAGNIDIRFHVKRLGGTSCLDDLAIRLFSQVSNLLESGTKVKLTHLLPIEDESRKIPGTGKYKGENFYGSQVERSEYVKYFNSLLDRIGKKLDIEVLKWTFDYNEMSFEDMEARQSVHVRPSSYMFNELLIPKKNVRSI
jgi:hypothetical protein